MSVPKSQCGMQCVPSPAAETRLVQTGMAKMACSGQDTCMSRPFSAGSEPNRSAKKPYGARAHGAHCSHCGDGRDCSGAAAQIAMRLSRWLETICVQNDSRLRPPISSRCPCSFSPKIEAVEGSCQNWPRSRCQRFSGSFCYQFLWSLHVKCLWFWASMGSAIPLGSLALGCVACTSMHNGSTLAELFRYFNAFSDFSKHINRYGWLGILPFGLDEHGTNGLGLLMKADVRSVSACTPCEVE